MTMNVTRQQSLNFAIPIVSGVIVAGIAGVSGRTLSQFALAGLAGLGTGIGTIVATHSATNDLRSRNKLLEQEISKQSVTETIHQLKERKKLINLEIASLEERRNQSASIAGELEARQAQRQALVEEISQLQTTRQDLENRIAAIQKTNPTLESLENRQKELARLQQEIKQRDGEQVALQKKLDEMEEKKSRLQEIESLFFQRQSEIQEITTKIEQGQATLQDLNQQSVRLESLRYTYDELQQEKQAYESRRESLKAEVAKLEAERDRQQVTLQNRLNEIEEKKSRLQEIESLFLQRQSEIQEIITKIEQGQATLQDLNRQAVKLEFLRHTYDELQQEKQAYESRRESLKAEVVRLEAERARILSVIKDLEPQAQESDRLRAEIADLKAQRRIAEQRVKDIQHELEMLEINKLALEADIMRKQQKVKELEKQIYDLKEEIRSLKEEKTDIENSAKLALQALEEPIQDLPNTRLQNLDEDKFIKEFIESLEQKGLDFHERMVKAFHTSLKVQDISALVILAGISGTGKSELPQKYSEFIGAPLVMLPVQPRWDSPQDLQGFYNYIEKKYKPTELMHYLYQYQKDQKMKDRIILVLLDEMNLARVEYYFSDFLSKLEGRRNGHTTLSLDIGSLKLDKYQREVKLPQEFLFIGTMNEDETTQSLSDKVLDRANVLTFGKPNELKLRGKRQEVPKPSSYLPWSEFKEWLRDPDPNTTIVQEVKEFVDQANAIMEALGHPFAHRVYQAIAKYVVNYPGADKDETIRNQAIADQFGQKILPKLRGLRLEDTTVNNELEKMGALIDKLDDMALKVAFEKAKHGRYGQFQWKGMVYQNEDLP